MVSGEPSNLANTPCSRPLQEELADPTQGASAWSCREHAREAPGMARAPATGAHHPGLPSEALEAAPATRPHCFILEAKVAASPISSNSHEQTFQANTLKWLAQLNHSLPQIWWRGALSQPNSHIHTPHCAPADLIGSNCSFCTRKDNDRDCTGVFYLFLCDFLCWSPNFSTTISPRSRELPMPPYFRAVETWKEAGL